MADAKPTIIAYLKPQCGWSRGVRAVLAKYGLPFEDKDIINDPQNYQEMVQKSGQSMQPCVEVNGEMLADVDGDELEAWLVQKGYQAAGPDLGIPTDRACTDDEHEAMAQGRPAPVFFDEKKDD